MEKGMTLHNALAFKFKIKNYFLWLTIIFAAIFTTANASSNVNFFTAKCEANQEPETKNDDGKMDVTDAYYLCVQSPSDSSVYYACATPKPTSSSDNTNNLDNYCIGYNMASSDACVLGETPVLNRPWLVLSENHCKVTG